MASRFEEGREAIHHAVEFPEQRLQLQKIAYKSGLFGGRLSRPLGRNARKL